VTLRTNKGEQSIRGRGNGPIDAFIDALKTIGEEVQLADYQEHAVGRGANAKAAAYVEIAGPDGSGCGCGMDEDIAVAALRAVLSAVNRRAGK
jgi:2-isopropylmalate synthase